MDLVTYAVPFFFLLIFIELGYGYWTGNNTYRANDSLNSLSLGLINTLTKLAMLNIGALVFDLSADIAPFDMDITNPYHWVAGLVLYDFLYYWFHRISHERKIFWAAHVVHHQSQEYNLSTALRQTGTGFLITWVFYIPCFLLGMPVYMYVTIASAHLIYQFWIHTRHVPKLGRVFEFLFASPSNHRVHHGSNSIYLDKNHGGFFIIWDRLFGTFQEELDEVPVKYGLTTPLNTWDPVWANLHVYKDIVDDFRDAPDMRHRLYALISPTDWRLNKKPDIPTETETVDSTDNYDPPLSTKVRNSCIGIFALLAIVNIASSIFAGFMPYFDLLLVVLYQLLTVILIGLALEGRAAIRNFEYFRMGFTVIVSFYLYSRYEPEFIVMLTSAVVLSASSYLACNCFGKR